MAELRVRPRVLHRRRLQGGGRERAAKASRRQVAEHRSDHPRPRGASRSSRSPAAALPRGPHHGGDFFQGFTTHKNKYDFVTIEPAGGPWAPSRSRSRRASASTTGSTAGRCEARPALLQRSLSIVLGGVFHAAVLFLVAAGLQLVFGVAADPQPGLRLLLRAGRVLRRLGGDVGAWRRAAAPLFVVVLVGQPACPGRHRPARWSACSAHLRPRRELSAPPHLRAGADVRGRHPLRLGGRASPARPGSISPTDSSGSAASSSRSTT